MYVLNHLAGFGAGGAVAASNIFEITAFTGNGVSQDIQTGQNFADDGGISWFKHTSATNDHYLSDTERGATKTVYPNLALGEVTQVNGLTSFNGNGVSVGSESGFNASSVELALFSWLEKEGYLDIVSWSGNGSNPRNISHNLTVAPEMIWAKNRSNAFSWVAGHDAMTWTKWMQLEADAAQQNATSEWDNTAPTSSVFTVSSALNLSANAYIAFLFASLAGKSKMGSYTGDGTASQALTGFGFQPKLFISKMYDGVGDWGMLYQDGGGTDYSLNVNERLARYTAIGSLDSDGVTVTNSAWNTSSKNYLYAAWA